MPLYHARRATRDARRATCDVRRAACRDAAMPGCRDAAMISPAIETRSTAM
jgi:hypothetical protein